MCNSVSELKFITTKICFIKCYNTTSNIYQHIHPGPSKYALPHARMACGEQERICIEEYWVTLGETILIRIIYV
jgi:hypothetical protein